MFGKRIVCVAVSVVVVGLITVYVATVQGRRFALRQKYLLSRSHIKAEEDSYDWVTMGIRLGDDEKKVAATMAIAAKMATSFQFAPARAWTEGKGELLAVYDFSYEEQEKAFPRIFINEVFWIWFEASGGAIRMERIIIDNTYSHIVASQHQRINLVERSIENIRATSKPHRR